MEQSVRKQKRYHTSFVIRGALGLLSPVERRSLPPSTLHGFRRRNFSGMIGLDEDDNFFQHIEDFRDVYRVPILRNSVKGLAVAVRLYRRIFASLAQSKRILKENRGRFVEGIQRISSRLSLRKACALFGVSLQQFYRWRQEIDCPDSSLRRCRRQVSTQLTSQEESVVRSYMANEKFVNWSGISIYYQMLLDGAAFMSSNSFYSCVRRLRLARPVIRKPKPWRGIRVEKPFELLHMDSTQLKDRAGRRVWIHVIQDNFSRFPLGVRVSRDNSSQEAMLNLKTVVRDFGLVGRCFSLMTDDGSENKGRVNEFVANHGKIIRVDNLEFSNSMVEAQHKKFKYDWIFPAGPLSFEQIQEKVEVAAREFRTRPSGVLFGFSPAEVLDCAIPDRARFAAKIAQARRARPAINRMAACSVCSE